MKTTIYTKNPLYSNAIVDISCVTDTVAITVERFFITVERVFFIKTQ